MTTPTDPSNNVTDNGTPSPDASGVETTTLISGNYYQYLGVWNPNTIYHVAEDANGNALTYQGPNGTVTRPYEIVEYEGAYWLANQYSSDQNPTQAGNYGPWFLITGTIPSDATIANGTSSVYGVPVAGGSAPAPNPFPAVPFVVTGLSAIATSSTGVELFWNPAGVFGVGDVSGYSVYEVRPGATNLNQDLLLGTTTSTTFGATGLTAGTSYTFEVVASDAVGNSGSDNTSHPHDTLANTNGFNVTNAAGTISENPVVLGGTSDTETSATQYNGGTTTLAFSTVENPSVSITLPTAQAMSGKYFSPYVDVTVPGNDLLSLVQGSGLHNVTLAFLQTNENEVNSSGALTAGDVPAISFGGLNGLTPESTGTVISEVHAIEAAGGTVTVSVGGYTGLDPAIAAYDYYENALPANATAAQQASGIAAAAAILQSDFQSVITTYGVNHMDFDIENDVPLQSGGAATTLPNNETINPVVNNTTANTIRDMAILALEKANPGLVVSYTLAVNPNGLSSSQPSGGQGASMPTVQNDLGVLQQAASDGVKIAAVNLMAMDYGSSFDNGAATSTTTGVNAMATFAISAAETTESQILSIASQYPSWTAPQIGLTPMLGQNDVAAEVFTTADAQVVQNWASQQSYIAGMGEWELPRDNNGGSQGSNSPSANSDAASSSNSGVPQTTYQFSQTFNQVTATQYSATTDDFNGSGAGHFNGASAGADPLFVNTATNNYSEWTPTSSTGFTMNTQNFTVQTGFTLAASGDFNGDGKTDLLFVNGGGFYSEWQSSGQGGFVQNATSFTIAHGTNGNTQFSIAAVGDFNGDGKADVLFSDGSGDYYEWQGQASAASGSSTGNFTANAATFYVPASFEIAAVGDFNGDGKTDLIYEDSNNGSNYYVWEGKSAVASGSTTGNFTANAFTFSAPSSFSIVAVGDFNGDGKSDVILENTGGFYSEWQMNSAGTAFTQNVATFSVPTAWSIVSVGDYNNDGKADILFENAQTSQFSEWVSTGNSFTANASTGTLAGGYAPYDPIDTAPFTPAHTVGVSASTSGAVYRLDDSMSSVPAHVLSGHELFHMLA